MHIHIYTSFVCFFYFLFFEVLLLNLSFLLMFFAKICLFRPLLFSFSSHFFLSVVCH